MKSVISGALVAAMMSTVAISSGAFAADIKAQPIVPLTFDMSQLQQAYRASKIIGVTVVNEADETVGSIDDLLINRNDNVPYAVLSVGGFLGVGNKFVAVPYKSLHIVKDKIVLPGGSKEALKQLPEFKYQ